METIRRYYKSSAINQFILYGNVDDQVRFDGQSGGLRDAMKKLTEKFDVVITYGLDTGLRIEKGAESMGTIPEYGELPNSAIPALAFLIRREIYRRKEPKKGEKPPPPSKVAVIIYAAEKTAPNTSGRGSSYEAAQLVATLKAWSTEPIYRDYELASFLVTQNLSDIHDDLAKNSHALCVRIDLPNEATLLEQLGEWQKTYPDALKGADLAALARNLKGIMLDSIEQELCLAQLDKKAVDLTKIGELKKRLIEKEAGDIIEILDSKLTLNDVEGLDEAKALMRTHIKMWKEGDTKKFPKGYALIGPVGTGKTYLAKCLGGESVPVVVLKNFRTMWYGATEGNLERFFRTVRALAPCITFIDEADQALGKRDTNANDGGLSGRIYKMFAEEIGDPTTRGQILWILATSRIDLVETDLKRAGRIDVKIPLMPTGTQAEAAKLLRAIMAKADVDPGDLSNVTLPDWLTPGAADAITSDVYTALYEAKDKGATTTARGCLIELLKTYQPPTKLSIIEDQIRLAVNEASKLSLVPEPFRRFKEGASNPVQA
jgi:SpoVK/Ycf46/Vps4 family AAA+-type ATPase